MILFTPYLFLNDYLRHFSFKITNVCSTLEAFGVDELYKFTFYLLTYLILLPLPLQPLLPPVHSLHTHVTLIVDISL